MSAKRFQLIAASCERPFLRAILLAVVFALVIGAYSWNFDRRMVQLNAGYIQDSGQVLDGSERRRLDAVRDALQQAVGLKLLLRVEQGQGAVQVPRNAADTIFMGCNPQTGEALVVLAPLAKKVLGEGRRLLLEEELAQCLAQSLAQAQAQDGAQGAGKAPVFLCLERGAQALVQALAEAK